MRETRITGRTPACDGCTAKESCTKIDLRSFPVYLCAKCRDFLFGAPDGGAK